MVNNGAGNSVGGSGSSPGALIWKATKYIVALTAFIVALEAFFRTGESFTCYLRLDLPWCDSPPVECSTEMTWEEYGECEKQQEQ